MKEKKFNECGCFQGSNEAALGMFKNRQADKTTLKSSNAFASDLIFSLKKILSPIDQKTEDKYYSNSSTFCVFQMQQNGLK